MLLYNDFCPCQVTNQVLNGEGVGWLKVGRLKKLFEDEGYRVMAVAKANKTLDRKVGPDDHIDDVVRIIFRGKGPAFTCFTFLFFSPVHSEASVERDAQASSAPRHWSGIQLC